MKAFVAKLFSWWIPTALIIWAVGIGLIAVAPGVAAKATGSLVLLVAAGYTFFFLPACVKRDAEEML